MSRRDCPDSPNGPNGPNGPNNGQPNMPDLYQWSGDQQPQQGGGHCPGGPGGPGGNGQPGGPPDLYQFDGGQQVPGQAGSDQGGPGGPENPAIANWQPDYTYSSPAAKEWLKENEASRNQALHINADGTYTVQSGDCLSTIAQRALQDQGDSNINQSQINAEMNSIIKANDQTYSSLDYKPAYIQAGWKLRIPGEAPQGGSGGGSGQGDGPPQHQCVPHPEGNTPYFPPPPGYHGRPSVIINNYYIAGNAYINEGGGPGVQQTQGSWNGQGQGGWQGRGGWQGQGQMSPQNRFQCNGQGGQAESYYSGQGQGQGQSYNPSMQYQWASQSAGNGDGSGNYGNFNGPYYNPNNWNNPGSNYAGSAYYGQIQPIPNAYPGEGQAMPIPNATGNYQAQLINYETPQTGATYPAQYWQTEQD